MPEEMALAAIDRRAYARLLTRILPHIITTDDENERMIAELAKNRTIRWDTPSLCRDCAF